MPLLLVGLSVAGCFDSYGRDGRIDAGGLGDYACDCCGTPVLASGPAACGTGICDPYCGREPDGGLGADAPLDPTCGPRVPDVVCFDHVPAGRPTRVEVALGLEAECFCDQDLVCTASITGPRTVELTTSLCPETPICRACEGPPVGECELPALDAGTWHVVANGEDLLDLEVTRGDVLPERADVCVRRAVVDGCGALWSPAPFDALRACHASAALTGSRVPIRVYDACGGCMQRGPCEVVVLDGTIRVSATRMPPSCEIACPPVCIPDEHVCLTPPLPAGSYRMVVDGLAVDESTTLEVGLVTGEEVCAGG